MKKIIKNSAVVWDYDLKSLDLKKSSDLCWFLSRKLRFGDLSGISRSDLKNNLDKLEINASLKELLHNFLNVRS